MTEWPQYESHKIVRAAKIVSIGEAHNRRVLMVDSGNGSPLEPFECGHQDMTDAAQPGWYAMVYSDGFRSASPPGQFEAGYTRVQH